LSDSSPGWLHLQIADALISFIVPVVAAILPARMTKSLLWQVARIGWLFADRSARVDRAAEKCFGETGNMQQHWRWATLMENSETWRLMVGLSPRISVDGEWPDEPGFVAAAMHYGSGIVALWHMRELGLQPRLVFRPVTRADMPGRPVLYLWSRLRLGLFFRLCLSRPIQTGGARETVADAIAHRDGSPMLAFDTPSSEPDRWAMTIGRGKMRLREGGLRIIRDTPCRLVAVSVTSNRQTGKAHLRIRQAEPGADQQQFLLEFMNRTIADDPGQWHLWPVIEGFIELDLERP